MSTAVSSFNRRMRRMAARRWKRAASRCPANRDDVFFRDQLQQIQNEAVFLEGDEEDIFTPTIFTARAMAAPARTVDPCSASLMKRMRRTMGGPGGSGRVKTLRHNVRKKQSGTPTQRSIFCNKGMFIALIIPAPIPPGGACRFGVAPVILGGQQNKGAARKGKPICRI